MGPNRSDETKKHSGIVINSVIFKRPGKSNRFGEAKKYFGRAINSIIFKKSGGPNRSGMAKRHYDGAKKHNEASVSTVVNYANEVECKNAVTMSQSIKGNPGINN